MPRVLVQCVIPGQLQRRGRPEENEDPMKTKMVLTAFGIATLLAPVGTPAREGLELRSAETLREALRAGLARGANQAEESAAEPRELAATA